MQSVSSNKYVQMSTSKVIYKGDLSTEATHLKSGTTIITDAPVDNNGLGRSFSPTDLVATALGSCILTIMGIKAREKEIDIVGATADVTKVMASGPRRIEQIQVEITMPANDYSDKSRKVLEAAAHHCPVGNSLADGVEAVTIKWLDDE